MVKCKELVSFRQAHFLENSNEITLVQVVNNCSPFPVLVCFKFFSGKDVYFFSGSWLLS